MASENKKNWELMALIFIFGCSVQLWLLQAVDANAVCLI